MYEVVRVVTQPCHGADGSVVHDVGEELPADGEAPSGVRFTLTAREVPDVPRRAARAASAQADAAAKDA